MLAALLFRLMELQLLQAAQLRRLAEDQAGRQITLPASRGAVYDRLGRVLAMNVPMWSVYADPKLVKDAPAVASALAPVLSLPPDALLTEFRRRGRFVWLARRLEPEQAARIRRLELPGIGVVEEERRAYPNGRLAATVLGFAGIDNQGLAGVELSYDRALRGSVGRADVRVDGVGHELPGSRRVVVPPQPGSSLVLAIDQVIQFVAERELALAVKPARAKGGTAIVMDPWTGELLALATEPGFDPNRPDPTRPTTWRNIAVSDVYEPGSTFKVLVAAAAVESGAVGPRDRFYCAGSITVAGTVIRDAERRPGGRRTQTLSDIIRNSCNVGATQVGVKLGKVRMAEWLRQFGFGGPTGIDLPGEATGLVRPIREWYEPTLQTISFGQGLSVTPVQLLAAVAVLANGGTIVRPHVGRALRTADGSTGPLSWPAGKRLISGATARAVATMMARVVTDGTGTAAAVEGYTVAGKTGTAQKPDPAGGYARGKFVASFVGFVPADAPRLAILVTIDEPRGRYYGGEVAAPLFARIALPVLRYLRVPPSTARSNSPTASPVR